MPTIEQYRSSLDELTRLASVDLTALWRQVTDSIIARELLADVLPDLTAVYGSAAGALSAEWYDDLRDSPGFRAIVADLPESGQTVSLAGWAADAGDLASSLAAAQGGMQRLITNVARDTVTGSSIADPQALGWQRSASGGCGFCQMLASRGAIYSARSVDFGAHDHCRCVAVPAFDGRPRPVKPYVPSSRVVTDADRARTREWMAEHGY